MFNKDKKIQIQQNIIEKLEQENVQLKEENAQLKAQLQLPVMGYEKAKELITNLEKREAEYLELIAKVKELQITCKNKIKEVSDLKKNYLKSFKTL